MQIDWDENEEFYRAWDEGRTGYPWIDAIMKQLHQHGWLHHLARHATVGCLRLKGPASIPQGQHYSKGQRTWSGSYVNVSSRTSMPVSSAGNASSCMPVRHSIPRQG